MRAAALLTWYALLLVPLRSSSMVVVPAEEQPRVRCAVVHDAGPSSVADGMPPCL